MLFVVLPAYNEGPALEQLLPKMISALKNYPFQIFVVNDGSQDNTAEVATEYADSGVTLLCHPQNRGLGEALRTGLLAALQASTDEDVIITLDSDNTHPPEIIPGMYDKVNSGLDLVVASRFVDGGQEVGLSLYRKILSRGAGWLMSMFFPLAGIKDYSCGFRAYRAGFLRRAFDYYGQSIFESRGFAVMVELLLKLAVFNPRCGEVPLILRYDRKEGKSKMPVVKTIIGYLGLILKLRRIHVHTEVEA